MKLRILLISFLILAMVSVGLCGFQGGLVKRVEIPFTTIKADDIPLPPSNFATANSDEDLVVWFARFDALPYTGKTTISPDHSNLYSMIEYRFGNLQGIPVFITSNMHGTESTSVASAYWLAYCVSYSKTPLFEWMRTYCDIRIMPFANPYGYTHNTRKNGNGVNPVDIARNFRWRWGSSQTTSDITYAGTEAASEQETAAIETCLADSPTKPQPWLYIDLHTGGAVAKRIDFAMPNAQVPQDKELASFVAQKTQNIISVYDADATCEAVAGTYVAAMGFPTNWSSTQGIVSISFETLVADSWGGNANLAHANFVRSYVAAMSCWIQAVVNGEKPLRPLPMQEFIYMWDVGNEGAQKFYPSGDICGNKTSKVAGMNGASSNITFVDSNPDTITDSGNGFLTAGSCDPAAFSETLSVGDKLVIAGTTNNNKTVTIASVAAGTITLSGTDILVNENPVTCRLHTYDSVKWIKSVGWDDPDYSDSPGVIYIDSTSTIMMSLNGSAFVNGASVYPVFNLWLENADYTECYNGGASVQSASLLTYAANGEYLPVANPVRKYQNVPAGTYYPKLLIKHLTTTFDAAKWVRNRYITLTVRVIPTPQTSTEYNKD